MRASIALLPALIWSSMAMADPSGYTGLTDRPVKALSDERISDLRAGRGMGLALTAELNGYPGPRHVLELAEQLELAPEQRARTEALFETMAREAAELGEQIVDEEVALDRLFAQGHAEPARVRAITHAIGRLEAELRAHHLNYHLEMMEVLDATQVARYREARGYVPQPHSAHRHRRH